MVEKERIGTPPKQKPGIFLEFYPNGEGEGLLNSQNFCKLTKLFFVYFNPELKKCLEESSLERFAKCKGLL